MKSMKNHLLSSRSIAVVKHLQGADNVADFMDYDTALLVFESLIDTIS